MQSLIPLFQQSLLALLGLCVNAAATLPLIATLGLVAGRRGNGRFCMQGSLLLLSFAICLAFCGPVFFICSPLFQLLAFDAGGNRILQSMFTLAAMPHTTSLAAWLAGMCLLYAARHFLGKNLAETVFSDDRYSLASVRLPALFCLLSALCFFSTFMLVNWPFAGLPDGLPWDRAVMAIGRHAARHYFMAFSAGGALALVLPACWDESNAIFSPRQSEIGRRWLALWAAIGYLPFSLQNWGLLIGAGMHTGIAPGSLHAQIIAQSLLTAAMVCWFWILLNKKAPRIIAGIALGLLVARALTPALWHFFKTF